LWIAPWNERLRAARVRPQHCRPFPRVSSPDHRVSSPDFCLAFAAWWLENKGENRSVPSNDVIGKALLAMSDAKIAIDRNELKDKHRRYYCGIILNDTGMDFHQAGLNNKNLEGKASRASETGLASSLIPKHGTRIRGHWSPGGRMQGAVDSLLRHS
jgi:hypothetical protein